MRSRRQFVGISSLALALIGCGGDDGTGGECSGIGATSTVEDGHSHDVCVPASDLGSTSRVALLYTTSSNEGHAHQITLSPEQLETLTAGGVVEVTTTVESGHVHDFTLTE